jgi:hypothetical protein
MVENNQTSVLRTRKRSHVVLIALTPVFGQIAVFFYIAILAEGAGPGGGMLGLHSFMILLLAIPIAMTANIIIATFTPELHFVWMLLLAFAIAILLPILGGLSLLLAP